MQVCIDYEKGWFLRINTKNIIRPCVKISKHDNAFLDHDSHIDCSLNEIDEYEIETAFEREGVIGKVEIGYAPTILDELLKTSFIRQDDKEHLKLVFAPYCED